MKPLQTILIAVDGSRSSDAALAFACSLVKAYGGNAHAYFVLEPHLELRGRHVQWMPETPPDERREATAIAREAEKTAARLGVTLRVTLLDGDPIDEIVRTADEMHASMIVIGNRGQNAFATLMVGSVAQGVVERSLVPVLVVHEIPAGNTAGDPHIRGVEAG